MPGLSHPLKRRRPKRPHPETSLGRVREVAVANIAQRAASPRVLEERQQDHCEGCGTSAASRVGTSLQPHPEAREGTVVLARGGRVAGEQSWSRAEEQGTI